MSGFGARRVVVGAASGAGSAGKMVEPSCHVTEDFGVVRQRTVTFDRVAGARRPDKR